ncbi:PAS domain S-box protein [Aliifodinibius sp. S!AR15-10]|uniref:sensor histidine kinase n=1 Tax=Aliifodinibius sp. S!AR15-10 TaxID=2950437 RepID=UPI0028647EEC|nr:histidine kinase dimerization/phosphoacceptor domain -containing protein [Aliifodinibius sp. S!AR15-10]MDR8393878.1 PAS domain S-box protein [Aliifodinibius sp. S!AR15-10]
MSESAKISDRKTAIRYITSISGKTEEEAGQLLNQLEQYPETKEMGVDEEELFPLLNTAIDATRDMLLITDARKQIGDEKIIYVNKGVEQVTGYSREELIGKNPKIFQGPETEKATIDRLRKKLAAGERFVGETFNYKKDGSKYRVRWSIDPIRDEEGEITHFISIQQDVTSEWEQKNRLEKTLDERESLLNEIHHRVKNNLAVISGLLDLQSAKSSSEETKKILSESVNRIQSIATLHEKLYETGNFNDIYLPEYIEGLLEHLVKTMSDQTTDITTKIDIADARLSVSNAVPLALIINELVTNSFQHGFQHREEGTLEISLDHDKEKFELTVADNGVGLPEELDVENLDSLGLRLIETLCNQLNGKYEFEKRNPGTRFKMMFDIDE